jgi:hypothetical protein
MRFNLLWSRVNCKALKDLRIYHKGRPLTRFTVPPVICTAERLTDIQRKYLIAFLGEIESVSSQHPLGQALTILAPPDSNLSEFLAEVRVRALTLSDFSIHRLSHEIVTSIDPVNSSSAFMDALQSALTDGSPRIQPRGLDDTIDKTIGVRVRGAHPEKAFYWPYKGQALDAFIEYLDIQWILMQKRSRQGESLQSRCGTIVQSSCAGKSRLVKEYPSLNLNGRTLIVGSGNTFSLQTLIYMMHRITAPH